MVSKGVSVSELYNSSTECLDTYVMLIVVCVTAAAPLVSNEAEVGNKPGSSSSGGPSIGLVAAMAAIVTGLVAVAIGVTVRHIRKRRRLVSMETGTGYDNDDESNADCSRTSQPDFNGAIQSTS